MRRKLLLFLLAAALLTVPVFADMGPKPQFTVRVENAPEELYYLDLLAEGSASRYPEGTMGGLKPSYVYTEEELAALDKDLLNAFTAAVPEGWYGCVTQGRLVLGNIDSEDGYFQFNYLGVPHVCRILIVTKSGETFLSEPFDRQVLQSSATVDWAAKTVETPPLWRGYAAQFLATFLPTLAIEGLLLLLFRLWSRRNALVFLGVNLLTQGGLTLWVSLQTVRSGTLWIEMIFADLECAFRFFEWRGLLSRLRVDPDYGLLPAEVLIFLAEMGLYMRFFRDCSKKRAALYALAANLCSFLLGMYLAETVWKTVAKTFL